MPALKLGKNKRIGRKCLKLGEEVLSHSFGCVDAYNRIQSANECPEGIESVAGEISPPDGDRSSLHRANFGGGGTDRMAVSAQRPTGGE